MGKNPEKRSKATGIHRDQLEELVAEYHPQLKSFISRRVNNSEDVEDILQEVFYQLAKTVNTALNPIEQVAAWLYRVTRNTIINHGVRKREAEMPFFVDEETGEAAPMDFLETAFGDDNGTGPESEYLHALIWDALEAALAELPVEQREVFVWTELEGIPVREIAQTTGVAVNTLLSRKHYAALHLRKRLAALYNELIYS